LGPLNILRWWILGPKGTSKRPKKTIFNSTNESLSFRGGNRKNNAVGEPEKPNFYN